MTRRSHSPVLAAICLTRPTVSGPLWAAAGASAELEGVSPGTLVPHSKFMNDSRGRTPLGVEDLYWLDCSLRSSHLPSRLRRFTVNQSSKTLQASCSSHKSDEKSKGPKTNRRWRGEESGSGRCPTWRA
jgi:hypothetical protein